MRLDHGSCLSDVAMKEQCKKLSIGFSVFHDFLSMKARTSLLNAFLEVGSD